MTGSPLLHLSPFFKVNVHVRPSLETLGADLASPKTRLLLRSYLYNPSKACRSIEALGVSIVFATSRVTGLAYKVTFKAPLDLL